MKPRTIQGREVKVGDRLTVPGTTDSRHKQTVSRVDADGLVQFKGDTYHRYSTEHRRHVYEDEEEV